MFIPNCSKKLLTSCLTIKLRIQSCTWVRFHQHVYSKLLRLQIPKAQRDSKVISIFSLLGSLQIKAARKMLVKLIAARTYAVLTVGISRNPLLPVVVMSRAGASLLLTFEPPSFKDTDALKTVAKKSHPLVTPPLPSSCCCSCCCCCCCFCCACVVVLLLWSLLKGLLLTVIFWLIGGFETPLRWETCISFHLLRLSTKLHNTI